MAGHGWKADIHDNARSVHRRGDWNASRSQLMERERPMRANERTQ